MRAPALILLAAALSSPAPAQDFVMEAGDLRRSNSAVGVTAWAFPLDTQWMSQPCLYEPNTNPQVIGDKIVLHDRSRVVALQRGDGYQVWKWQANTDGYIWNTPAWDPDRSRLYVPSTFGRLFALDLATGAPLWSVYEGTGPNCGSHASPIYQDGKILYKNGKRDYVCIDADDQSVIWRWSFNVTGFGCTPAMDGGRVYAASSKGELGCFNWSDGSTVWRTITNRRDCFTGAVTLDDTHLYVVTCHGRVDARLRSNGSLVWSYQMDSYTYANLSYSDNTLFCTSDDRCVHALDPANGSLKWKRCHSGNFARSSPFSAGGTVFSSGCTGEFYGDDAATGANVWVASHGADNSFNDWAYADGYLYVSNRIGTVYALRSSCPGCTPTQTLSPSMTPTESASPTPSATPTDTGTATPSATLTASPSGTPSATPSSTPSATPTISPTRTASPTPSLTATRTPSSSATPSRSPSPSATPSRTASATPVASAPGDAPADLDDPGKGCYAYPNPSEGGDVHVVYRVDGPCKARIRVFQSAGDPAALIEERHESAGVKRCRVPAAQFASGVYFYKVDMRYDDGKHDKRPIGKFVCRPR